MLALHILQAALFGIGVVIMVGAVTLTAVSMGVAAASFPLVVGIAAAFVAYGRTHLAPIA